MYQRKKNQAKERLQSFEPVMHVQVNKFEWLFFNLNFSLNTCRCDRYLLPIQKKKSIVHILEQVNWHRQ